jgi:hypothetical protein
MNINKIFIFLIDALNTHIGNRTRVSSLEGRRSTTIPYALCFGESVSPHIFLVLFEDFILFSLRLSNHRFRP